MINMIVAFLIFTIIVLLVRAIHRDNEEMMVRINDQRKEIEERLRKYKEDGVEIPEDWHKHIND